ncbi:hypothetical protein V2G26_004965 [Clonostachys chloroleuca]
MQIPAQRSPSIVLCRRFTVASEPRARARADGGPGEDETFAGSHNMINQPTKAPPQRACRKGGAGLGLGHWEEKRNEPSTVEMAVVCSYWITFALSDDILRSWRMVACPLTQMVMFIVGINQLRAK